MPEIYKAYTKQVFSRRFPSVCKHNGRGIRPAAKRRKENGLWLFRCSTNETKQDINRQVRELKAAGAEEIFMEYEHGDAKIKSQQQAMFAQAHAGIPSPYWRFPALPEARSSFVEIIDLVREKHLRLVIVGSIILDCRSGLPNPMSELSTNGRRVQSAGIVHDKNACAVWNGERQSQRKRIGRPQVTVEICPARF